MLFTVYTNSTVLLYTNSPTFPRGLCDFRTPPFPCFWLVSSLIVFCIDLIAYHKDVTCFGRTFPATALTVIFIVTTTYVGNGKIQTFVLFLLSGAGDVCGIFPDGISLGKTFAPRGLDRRADLRCRDYPRGNKGAGVICLFNTVLHGCETVPHTIYVKAMPGDPGRGEYGREMPSG